MDYIFCSNLPGEVVGVGRVDGVVTEVVVVWMVVVVVTSGFTQSVDGSLSQ